MATFEDRLLHELRQHRCDPALAVPDKSGRARLVGAATISAVIAASALIGPAVLGAEGSSAYALSTGADGSVTFTLLELRDLDEATRALNEAGVPAVVRAATEDCADKTVGRRAPDAALEWPVDGDEGRLRIHPSAMPADTVLGLTALAGKRDPVVKVLLYDAPGPACFPLGKPGDK